MRKFLASLNTISFKDNSLRQTYLLITHLKIYCEQINIRTYGVRNIVDKRVANSSPCSNFYSGREMSKYSRYFWNEQNSVELHAMHKMPRKGNSSRPLIHKPVGHIQFCYNSKYL